ncbi:glycosyltransferase family 4 protein [Rhizosphaericola mali]|uniref:Glycosyltransferase family 4 protein n=1 Tax=Rhizosphaericola mali TaxID=2545455 RepID=A0A5P2G389_9BACT|nr:glycosyltransferase family 4 protein [Rhizosphaericola mali]QES89188.1 glycosyltransferase family 4 protein [Rhizosphaericola mali]
MEIRSIFLFVAEINKPGGTERVVVNLANSFHKRGYSVTVVSVNTQHGNTFYLLEQGVALIHLGVVLERNVLKRVSFGFRNTVNRIKSILPKSPTILMATDPITCYALALIQPKFPLHKYIACEHMGLAIAQKYSLLARKWLFGRMDAIVTLTQRDKSALLNAKIPHKHIAVIPNEISFFPENTCDYKAKQILTVGKYDNQKGYDLLLKYVIPLLRNYQDWKLVLVGQGEWKTSLQKNIEDASLTKQIELHQPTKDIVQYYLKSSIYVMSSRYEGFPMVLLEARACGLPVLSVDCPSGPADILHEDDGILVPMNDAWSFREGLEKLMKNIELRRNLGQNAQKDSENYNSDSIYQQWKALFDEL